MAEVSRISLVSLSAAFLAGAAGGFLGSQLWLQGPRGGAEGSPRGDRESAAELNESMRQLTAELRRLADRPARAADGASPTSTVRESAAAPAPGLNPNKDEILAAIDRLTIAIGGSGASHATSSTPLVATTPPQLKKLTEISEALDHGDSEAVSPPYFFLTYQQVLDRFGKPTGIFAHDGHVRWEYSIPNPGSEDHRTVTFDFIDGFVIRVDG